MIKDYICLDLETTGLNPKTDKIIEIGVVKVRDGEITERFSKMVNPGRLLEPRITEITGIVDKDLEDAGFIWEILPEFLQFIGEDILLGHCVLFDYSFVKKAAVNLNQSFEHTGIDTLKIARKYLSTLESRSLGFLCEHYQIPHKAHRAMEDAVATHKLYQKLCEDFYEENDFAPTKLVYQVKKETPITKSQKERLGKLIEYYHLEKYYDLDCLTRNEASRITDQILATYGRLVSS